MPLGTKRNRDALGADFDQRVFLEGDGTVQGVVQVAKSDGVVVDPATSTKQPALGIAGTPSADVLTVQGAASMTAFKTDGSAVTQPVSAASLPLPSGAATEAKQPALGTAGSPSANVLTVQGVTSMTALKVDGSAVTQPVSAAALPLPTGAATAAKQPALGTAGAPASDVITIQGIASMEPIKVSSTSSTSLADSDRMPIDDRDGLTINGSVTSAAVLFSQDLLGYQSISVQVTSPGTSCTITYEISNDNTNWNPTAGLNSIAVGNNAAQTISTTAINLVFGRAAARYFRARVSVYGSGTVTVVALASKVSVANIVASAGTSFQLSNGQASHDAAISGAPVRIGARALTADYNAVAGGDVADLKATLTGALITRPYAIPEAEWSYPAAASGIVNTTTAVEIKAAAAAGLRNYITAIDITAEALGAATELAIRDGAGGAVLWRTKIGTAGLPLTRLPFPTPLKGTAATLLEVVTLTASVTGAVYFNASGFSAP